MSRKWCLRNNLEKGKEAQDQVTEFAQVHFNAQSETGKKKKTESGEKTVKTRNQPQKVRLFYFFQSIFFAELTLD